jgi:hypothetical protein
MSKKIYEENWIYTFFLQKGETAMGDNKFHFISHTLTDD